jgi:glycosyltransferase involved in cell wall biosynthesis
VFAQDVPVVVIVVDDGSEDDTASILASYGERVKAIRQANAGAGAARNAGMDAASGAFIAFLDADDVWLPGKLRQQLDVLRQRPRVGFVFSGWRCLYPDGSTSDVHPTESLSYSDLLMDCRILTSTVVMRRSLADLVGRFATELRRGQDYNYWIRVSVATEIVAIPSPLAIYRVNGPAQVRKTAGVNWEREVIARALSKFGCGGMPRAQIRRRLWQLSFQFGYARFSIGDYRGALKAFAGSIAYRPLYAKGYLYTIASLLGAPLGARDRRQGA